MSVCNANTITWFDEHLSSDEVLGKRILEVGSRNINGSIRPVLMAKGAEEYIGIDMIPGAGVDYCCNASRAVEWFGEASFDLVVSSSCLEHVENIMAAVHNIKLVCRPGGLIVLAVPDVWPKHDYPGDYWRISMGAMADLFADCTQLLLERQPQRKGRSLVFGKWRKSVEFREMQMPLLLVQPGVDGS